MLGLKVYAKPESNFQYAVIIKGQSGKPDKEQNFRRMVDLLVLQCLQSSDEIFHCGGGCRSASYSRSVSTRTQQPYLPTICQPSFCDWPFLSGPVCKVSYLKILPVPALPVANAFHLIALSAYS